MALLVSFSACIFRTEEKTLGFSRMGEKKIEIDYLIVTVVDWKILKVYVQ